MPKGFTLIELIVAISILAIISAIGLTSYAKAQVIARDSRRKQDLRSIKAALDLYYQKNKSYPAIEWINSTTNGNFWITGLDTNYINTTPKDPKNVCINTTINPRDGGTNCFVYAYYSGTWNNISTTNPGFILSTRLENSKDPDAGKPAYVGSSTLTPWPELNNTCPACFTLGNN